MFAKSAGGLRHRWAFEQTETAEFIMSIDKNNHIFLCHAHEDKPVVLDIYNKLKDAGLSPWLDTKDIFPGQNWDHEIQKALKKSSFILIFFSKISISKHGYIQKEFKLALDIMEEIPEGEIFIIPVRIDDCKVPLRFNNLQYCNLYESEGLKYIIKAIKHKTNKFTGKTIVEADANDDDLEEIVIPPSVFPESPQFLPSGSVCFVLCLRETGKRFLIKTPDTIEIERLAIYLVAKLLPNMLNEGYVWTLEYKGKELPEYHTVKTAGIKENDLTYLVGNKSNPKIKPFSY